MKTVLNSKNTSIMKNYVKYICAFLLLLGTSAHAWGAGICIRYPNSGSGQTNYYNGQTITINLELEDGEAYGTNTIAVKNDAGWSKSSYYYGYIHCAISGTYVYSNLSFEISSLGGNNCEPYWEDEDHYTGFATWNNNQYSYTYCFDIIISSATWHSFT